jgi:outer membrane receptor for ferrienterochelin and colicins
MILHYQQSIMKTPPFAVRLLVLALASASAYSQTAEVRTLPTVVVTNAASMAKPGALRDEITKTESISGNEIKNSGATNLPELMTNRPGVDVQIECSVCNSRNITLNNLPGRFTTLMVDGVPIFSSVSNAYGLDMIGLEGLERIDISRGAGTSLIAPESLAGTVNLVTKRPIKDGFDIDIGVGSFGMQRKSFYGTKVLTGGAISLSGTLQQQDSVDALGTGVSQYTGYDRKQFGAGLFLDDVGGFKVKARLDHFEEKRMGGPLGTDYDAVRADVAGNPFDFSKGPNASPATNDWIDPSTGLLTGTAYNDGRFGLAQIIFTKRNQLVTTAERMTNAGKLRFALGYAEHGQDSWYGGDADYFGKQKKYYLESSLQQSLGETLVTGGISYRYEDLSSISYPLNVPPARMDADAYTYRTPGVFLQAYRSFFGEKLEVNASLRYDNNNVFGGITTPRINALWHHTDEISSRLAMGTGYRMPTSFFELEHAILTAPSVDRSRAEAERSENLSYAWSYAGDRVSVTASANHTRIKNMALFVDDTANSGNFLLQAAPSAYTINNVDLVGTWQVSPKNAITVGIEKYDYDFNSADFQGSLFSRPDYRFMMALDHSNGPWNFNVKATLTGPQNLAKFYDYANNPRYNLDGTPKPDTSPTFWVVDMHANYQWNAKVSAYIGVNNVFDYQQAKNDNYLWVNGTGGLDVTHIWGPNMGRSIAAGIKVAF